MCMVNRLMFCSVDKQKMLELRNWLTEACNILGDTDFNVPNVVLIEDVFCIRMDINLTTYEDIIALRCVGSSEKLKGIVGFYKWSQNKHIWAYNGADVSTCRKVGNYDERSMSRDYFGEMYIVVPLLYFWDEVKAECEIK